MNNQSQFQYDPSRNLYINMYTGQYFSTADNRNFTPINEYNEAVRSQIAEAKRQHYIKIINNNNIIIDDLKNIDLYDSNGVIKNAILNYYGIDNNSKSLHSKMDEINNTVQDLVKQFKT